jgi:hypothetical protein
MQVMRDVAPKDIELAKDMDLAKDADAHLDAAVDVVLVVAHCSMWVGVSPHPKDVHSHMLRREGGFPKDILVAIKEAQHGPQLLYQRHLSPLAEHKEDSQAHRLIVTQQISMDRLRPSNNLFPIW